MAEQTGFVKTWTGGVRGKEPLYQHQPERWYARDLLTPEELELAGLRAENAALGATLKQIEEDVCYHQLEHERDHATVLAQAVTIGALAANNRRLEAELAELKAQQAEDDDNGARIEAEMMARANRRAA